MTTEHIELPPLPEPYAVASTMKCVACGAPYEPARAAAPMAAAAHFSRTVATSACKCGSTTFGGALSYDSPSPAQFTAEQMNARYIAGFEAGRSRAASESGEVARLAEDARSAAHDVATCHTSDKLGRLLNRIADLEHLANAATSPASEAQAGWRQVLKCAKDGLGAGGRNHCDQEFIDYGAALIDHIEEGIEALAASPHAQVAAEGQKAAAKPLDDPRLQELFTACIDGALTSGYQGVAVPPDGHWLEFWWKKGRVVAMAEEGARRTTPTASMVDAAEATIYCVNCDCPTPQGCGGAFDGDLPCARTNPKASTSTEPPMSPDGEGPLYTPGPRGENAGGVVEAWQPIATALKNGTHILAMIPDSDR